MDPFVCGTVLVARPAEADMKIEKLVGLLADLERDLIEDTLISDVVRGRQLSPADHTGESLRIEGPHSAHHSQLKILQYLYKIVLTF